MACEDLFCVEYFAGVASVTGGFRLVAQSVQIEVGQSLNIVFFPI